MICEESLRQKITSENWDFFFMCCVVSSFLLEKSSQSKNLPIHPNISEPLLGCVFLYQTSSRAVFFGISLCIPPRARRWAKNPGPDIGSSRILEGKSHRVFLADLAKGASQSRLRDRKLELDGFWMVSGCFEKKPVLSKRQSCKKKSCFREKCIIFRRKSLDVSERLWEKRNSDNEFDAVPHVETMKP